MRIQAEIESTPTLRNAYYVKDKRRPAIIALPDSISATAGSPVVIVRGFIASSFSFNTRVRVYGGGGYRDHYSYDRVQVGVIQNLLDPKAEGLKGEYCRGTKRGTFAESFPLEPDPWVDASDNLPLYDALVKRAPGTDRTIEFTDLPGLRVPPFVLPSGGKATPCGARTDDAYGVCGARGKNQFRTAVVAWSTYAPHTFVVVATLEWELYLNVGITNPGSGSPIARQRGKRETRGTRVTGRQVYPRPQDAHAAGFEVYGPRVTSVVRGSETRYDRYVWSPEPDAEPGWDEAHATGVSRPMAGQQRVLLSGGARARSEEGNTPRSGSSGGGGKDEE